MRGPLILAATVLVGGTLLFGLSRFGGADATVLPQDAPPAPLAAAPVDLTLPVMTVYKSPTCGCCTAWIDHLLAAGRLRLEHRQASLEELGRLHQPELTKDAVAGRIRRLLSTADKAAEAQGIPNTEASLPEDLRDE